MPENLKPAPVGFSHRPTKEGERLLIEAVCIRCGASKLVSTYDNSLEYWEKTHKCDKQAATQRDAG